MATLDDIELSIELSRPIELYQFSIQGTTYRYTSAEGTVTWNGADYSPLPIKRTSWQDSREQKTASITLTLPTSNVVASLFLGIQPSAAMTVTVLRVQPFAVPSTASIVMFSGYIASTSFKDEKCEFKCVPHNELFTRTMPRINYQGLCNHVLYDTKCGVVSASHKFTGKVLGVIDSVNVDIQALPTSGTPYVGGYLEVPDGSEQRLIIAQSGQIVTILYPFRQSITGSNIDAYEGCDHTPQTCASKFSNILNYGGFPFVPSVNPYNKQQIAKE